MDKILAQQPPVMGKFDRTPELSIIVPTFCERGNVDALIEEVAGALPDVSWEILFVDDDSNDGTAEHVRSL